MGISTYKIGGDTILGKRKNKNKSKPGLMGILTRSYKTGLMGIST
jgi:hypothetical protein